jgi:predicted HTH domain antitoxin
LATRHFRHKHASMPLTLPDDPALSRVGTEALRLSLACALYSAGKISRGVGARIAGVSRRAFDEALSDLRIPFYTPEMLEEDLRA